MVTNNPKIHPFSLRHMDPYLIHPTTPNDSSIAVRTSAQLRNKVTIGYSGTPQIHPKTAPSSLTITTPSDTPIPQLTHPPSQVASICSHPFCHNTLCRPTRVSIPGLPFPGRPGFPDFCHSRIPGNEHASFLANSGNARQ